VIKIQLELGVETYKNTVSEDPLFLANTILRCSQDSRYPMVVPP